MHSVVLWWHALERGLLFVAYNVAWCGQHHTAAWDIGHWPFTWSWWARIPYGGLLAMERAQTRLAFDARGALQTEHLVLGGFTAILGLAALVWLRGRRLDARWLADPIVTVRSPLPRGRHWATDAELAPYTGSETPMALGFVMRPVTRHAGTPRETQQLVTGRTWLTLPQRDLERSVLDVAPPGQGKTAHIVGNLLRLGAPRRRERDARYSFLLWDVKGELEGLTAAHLTRAGYVVTVVHPYERKARINPAVYLERPAEWDTFWEAWLANSDSGIGSATADDAHEQWSRQIMTGLSLGLQQRARRAGTEVTLPEIFAFLQRDDDTIATVLGEAQDGGAGASMWRTVRAKGGTAFSNQRGSLVLRGEMFKDAEVRWVCGGNDVDLDGLYGVDGAAPHALFLQIPTDQQRRVQPLTAALTALVFARAQRVARGRLLPRRLLCLFDEAGSGATIPRLYDWINTLRSTGIAQWIVVQYMEQLDHKYGKKGRVGIETGCGIWLGRRGMRPEDAEAFSVQLGRERLLARKMERVIVNGKRRLREIGQSEETPPLYAAQNIRALPQWALVVAFNDRAGLLCVHPPYYEDARLAARAGAPAPGRDAQTERGGQEATREEQGQMEGHDRVAVPTSVVAEETTQQVPAVVVRRREPVPFRHQSERGKHNGRR